MEITIEMVVGAYFLGRADNGILEEMASNMLCAEMLQCRPSEFTLRLMHQAGSVLQERVNAPKPAAG